MTLGARPASALALSINSIAPDRGDADSMTGNRSAPWQKFSVGETLGSMGMPVAFEWGDNPTGGAAKTQDPYQYNYWTMLSAAGAHGDFALPQWTWNPYWTDPAWEINDYWFNSDRRAWLVFRDREWPTFNWWTTPDGRSGMIGDYGKYLTLVNPEAAPQACAPAIAATAQANANSLRSQGLSPTPACPGQPLPTPAITPAPTASPGADTLNRLFNRQARRLGNSSEMAIVADPGWRYYGQAYTATITVSYLDAGADMFDVYVPSGDGGAPARHTIKKSGSGQWKRESWEQTVDVANSAPTNAFVRIVNDGGGEEYIHEFYIDVQGQASVGPTRTRTPTAPPTPRPSASATASTSPTRTATQTATVPTLTPTATRHRCPPPPGPARRHLRSAPHLRQQRQLPSRKAIGWGCFFPSSATRAGRCPKRTSGMMLQRRPPMSTSPRSSIRRRPRGTGFPLSDYRLGMDELKRANVAMIGYVPTNFGARPIVDVKADIDKWNADYAPWIGGIFLDDVSGTSGSFPLLRGTPQLYQAKAPGRQADHAQPGHVAGSQLHNPRRRVGAFRRIIR